ncbi:hypothetical protein PHMEG_0004302 [Phytophthora megakarya]|uniref:ZSWIM1/3 RNaseH-like domain-containing protein n=1 Tax=Phytophthora megakarya TaxID=4795 RepID=A0A225WU59_9STRA|nr:hypothetical protein PHMEG_0004302 [Phytophthora megakarya]
MDLETNDPDPHKSEMSLFLENLCLVPDIPSLVSEIIDYQEHSQVTKTLEQQRKVKRKSNSFGDPLARARAEGRRTSNPTRSVPTLTTNPAGCQAATKTEPKGIHKGHTPTLERSRSRVSDPSTREFSNSLDPLGYRTIHLRWKRFTDLATAAKPKNILKYLQETTGKCVTLQDVHNLVKRSKARRQGEGTIEDRLDTVMLKFCSVRGNNATIFVDNTKTTQTITIQSRQMMRFFEDFPGVVMLDSTH